MPSIGEDRKDHLVGLLEELIERFDFLDTEVAAIKAKTDQLTFTAGKVDADATLAVDAAAQPTKPG